MTKEIFFKHDAISINKTVMDCWMAVLKIEKIKLGDDFFELGGDSFLALKLLKLLEKKLMLVIDEVAFFEMNTLAKQSEYIKKILGINNASIVVEFQQGTKSPLVFVHPLGGSLFSYMPLIGNFKKNRPVVGIQDAFFSGRLHFYSSVQEIASYYIEQLDAYATMDALILCGYSSGGTVAFEMARQLIEKGKKILHLFVFDSWAKMPFDIGIKKELKKIIIRQADNLEIYRTPNFVVNADHWLEILQNRVEILIDYLPKRIPINMTLFTPIEILEEYSKNKCDDNGWQFYVDQVTVVQGNGNLENMLEEKNIKQIKDYFIEATNQLH